MRCSVCLHCGATPSRALRAFNAPVRAPGPVVRVSQATIAARARRIERHHYIGFISGEHIDSCWIGVARDDDGDIVALLPGGALDWRGGFRHPATEEALARARRAGHADLLGVLLLPAVVPANDLDDLPAAA